MERVRDLLAEPGSKSKPKVRENAITGPYVEDLTTHAVNSSDMVLALMDEGNRVRFDT